MYKRPRRYHSRKQRGVMDYLMPFLIIICIGVIGVLFWNLKKALFDAPASQAAYMHLVQGNVEMKAWGTEEYFDRSTDAVIMDGDEIRTFADARVIVEFFDGTIMRVGGGTTIGFENIDQDAKTPYIGLVLYSGDVWFNQIFKSTGLTNVSVRVDEIVVNSVAASIFAVENDLNQTVSVISVFDNEGASVDITAEGTDETVIESEIIGIGQEIVITPVVLDRYWQYQSPSVLSGISDEFKNSSWYKWNIAEDTAPTEFKKEVGGSNVGLVKVDPELVDNGFVDEEEKVDEEFVPDKPSEEDEAETETGELVEDESIDEVSVQLGDLMAPTITTVSGGSQIDDNGFYHVSGKVATIAGGVSGAAKVVVNGYTLTKFNAGDSTWTYFANADYDLMTVGENIYEVVAYDADGNPSETLTVKVYYSPPQPELAAEPVEDVTPEVEGDATDPLLAE